MFRDHEKAMTQHRQWQIEKAELERYFSKKLISHAGQNDISNSVWVDTQQYAAKQEPELLLRDLEGRLRNGRVEPGRSPFSKQDFLRMDG